MQLNEYQELAQRTSRKDISPDDHLFNGLLGLAGESGECCDLAKKHYFQDERNIYQDLIDELGDVMWYVVEVASALGVSLEEVAKHNIDKLRKRYPDGFDSNRSLHRDKGFGSTGKQ
jgi:NTP pyrophosphatase (non-canonical NTP hydrolase)